MTDITEHLNQKIEKLDRQAKQVEFNFIRNSITLLTPSLTLLIGLQEANLPKTSIIHYALLTSIVLLSLTILVGLVSLRAESKLHALEKEYIQTGLNTLKRTGSYHNSPELPLPKWIQLARNAFHLLIFLSILSLCIFGFSKYTF